MNHVNFPGVDGEVRRLKVDLVNDGRPADQVLVDNQVISVWKAAVDFLPKTEFKEEVIALFQPGTGDSLGTWFNRILLRLFSDEGLVVVEPHLLRDLSTPIIQS